MSTRAFPVETFSPSLLSSSTSWGRGKGGGRNCWSRGRKDDDTKDGRRVDGMEVSRREMLLLSARDSALTCQCTKVRNIHYARGGRKDDSTGG